MRFILILTCQNHGRTPTDIYVHTILIYAVLLLIIVGALEAIYPKSILMGLARSLLIMAQGTWFWHVSIKMNRI